MRMLWNWISYSKWRSVRRRLQLRYFPEIRFVWFAIFNISVHANMYSHNFWVFFESCDQPIPGPFPALPIFLGKKPWERGWGYWRKSQRKARIWGLPVIRGVSNRGEGRGEKSTRTSNNWGKSGSTLTSVMWLVYVKHATSPTSLPIHKGSFTNSTPY